MSPNSPAWYLFLDVETPGVSPLPQDRVFDRIFEVAAIVTDADFNELGRFETVVRPTLESLAQLHADPYVVQMHVKSGLYAILTGSGAGSLPTMEDAEQGVLDLLAEHLPDGERICIAGSGVARFDHPILEVQMPRLAERLFYFEQDPSSARRLYKQRTGQDIVPPKPEKTHRAMADIEDDIRHLKAFARIYDNAIVSSHRMDPQSRALSAVGLALAYLDGDTDSVGVLLQGLTALDVAAGFMDVVERLSKRIADEHGVLAEGVLAGVREDIFETTY